MVIFLFSLGRFRGGFESIEAPGPVLVEEGAKSCHFIDVGAVEAARTGAAFTHQIRLSQYSQMLGDRRLPGPGALLETGPPATAPGGPGGGRSRPEPVFRVRSRASSGPGVEWWR